MAAKKIFKNVKAFYWNYDSDCDTLSRKAISFFVSTGFEPTFL